MPSERKTGASAPHPRIRSGAGASATRSSPPPGKRGEDRDEGLPRLVCVGVVTGAHGVTGAVRIKSFTARPEDVAGYGPLVDQSGTRCLELRLLGAAKGVLIGRFADVDDRNQAEALHGRHLYLPRAALPPPGEEEYYHADLIGLDAVLIGGEHLGRVRAIHDFGAGDTLEIERKAAPPIMVPFTRIAVPVIDIKGGQIVIDPPEGLLEPSKKDTLPGRSPTPTPKGAREAKVKRA